MAKISAGILNETTGKVGPVICSTWKGINYVRSYVVPIDRKSDLQIAERAGFTYLMNICKLNYANIIKQHLSLVCEGQQYTPWNEYFRLNRTLNVTAADVENLQFSDGVVGDVQDLHCYRLLPSSLTTIYWSSAPDQYRRPTDRLELYKLDRESLIITRIGGEVIPRSAGSFSLGYQDSDFVTKYLIFAIAQRTGTGYSKTAGCVPTNYSP